MKRREALKSVAFMMGGIISATTMSALYTSCNSKLSNDPKILIDDNSAKIIDEFADIIIPTTTTPGAKAAGVGSFIIVMIKDCYPEDIQKIFIKGIEEVEKRALAIYNKSFIQIGTDEKNNLVAIFLKEAIEHKNNNKMVDNDEPKPHFFQLIKELTVLGYFTSEIGATQSLSHVSIPGKYEGCIPLQKDQKSWSI